MCVCLKHVLVLITSLYLTIFNIATINNYLHFNEVTEMYDSVQNQFCTGNPCKESFTEQNQTQTFTLK